MNNAILVVGKVILKWSAMHNGQISLYNAMFYKIYGSIL